VTANEDFLNKIERLGLCKMARETGLDRKAIRQIALGKVKLSTLGQAIGGLRLLKARSFGRGFVRTEV